MKYFLVFMLLLATLSFGQVNANIDIGIPAPQIVLDEIRTLQIYIEEAPHGSPINLYRGMPLYEILALDPEHIASYQVQGLDSINVDFQLLANGNDIQVAAVGIDSSGNEIVIIEGDITHYLRTGVSGIMQLPLLEDRNYFIDVTVTFE